MNTTIEQFLKELKGLECWACIAGKGSGSMVNMYFGDKKKRSLPIDNPHLTEDERNYEGEYGLFIQFAPWRILHNSQLFLCWNLPEEVISEKIKAISGCAIRDCKICPITQDLELYFSNQYILSIFCDQIGTNDPYGNYTLYGPTGSISVNSKFVIDIETN